MRQLKAQSLSEYTICVLGIILVALGMQTYIRRGLQGRYTDVVDFATARVTNISQYEPYYTNFEEGTQNEGVVQNRVINYNFQPRGQVVTNIVSDGTSTPRRTSIEETNCYDDE